jgi:hypothetical protein
MGIIKEEKQFQDVPEISISVVQRQKDENYEPWRIILIDCETFEYLTPSEVRNFGKWLIRQGERVGKEYTANGSKRVVKEASWNE